jgi:hypothetical protein
MSNYKMTGKTTEDTASGGVSQRFLFATTLPALKGGERRWIGNLLYWPGSYPSDFINIIYLMVLSLSP